MVLGHTVWYWQQKGKWVLDVWDTSKPVKKFYRKLLNKEPTQATIDLHRSAAKRKLGADNVKGKR